ncbi:MAG: sugar ABC transporter permease [Oscillospiraceae bacterium]|nr:sugar ABC transporter permease [Oscillospiraceae bacterium]MDD4368608.1 sugar ABC transporter permease [Oscillospiraceae bacterium]
MKSALSRRTGSRHQLADAMWGYFFVAPVVIGLAVFYAFPFLQNIYFSFCEVDRFNRSSFIGLDNYREMFSSGELYQSTGNTFLYVLLTVPLGIFLAILVAALLNSKARGQSALRTLYYLPAITMPAAIAMVWKWIYNGNYGVLNEFLKVFGVSGRNWLNESATALIAVAVVGIWSMVGYNMVILLAGMQGISPSYYEAAQIDGAGALACFFHITIPMLSPSIFFVLITSLISGFQVFDTIYMMIGKTSLAYESTQSLVMLFYRNAFDYGYKGYASAVSIYIFVIILLFTLIQFVAQKKWVHYE